MHSNEQGEETPLWRADDLEAERITPGEHGEPAIPRDVNDNDEDDDAFDDDQDEGEGKDHDPGELIVDPQPS